jgi:hypothetical protein
MADQLGPHVEAKLRAARADSQDLEAQDLVEGDQALEKLGERRVEPALLGGTSAGDRWRGRHHGAGLRRLGRSRGG